MRKYLLGLVLALSLSSLPAFSANIPKAGSACNKKGVTKTYKGKEFKCLMKGGKLVWSKGKVVNKETSVAAPEVTPSVATSPTPTPTPSPSPSSTPIPTTFPTPTPTPTSERPSQNSSQLNPETNVKSQIQFEDMTRQLNDDSLKPKFIFKVISHPDVKSSSIENITQKYFSAYNFWSHYVTDLKDLILVIGTGDDVKWLSDQIDKFNGHPDNLFYQSNLDAVSREPCQNFGAGSLFLLKDVYVNTYRLYPKQCSTQEPTKPEYVGAPFHEFTHNMQTTLAGDARFLPCWIKEGQATFYENNLGNAGKLEEFSRVKNVWFSRINKTKFSQTLLKLDINYGDGLCSRDGGFEYGYVAMQLLANEFGQSKSIDLLKEVGKSNDWKSAFKSTYGITFEDWLNRAEVELKDF